MYSSFIHSGHFHSTSSSPLLPGGAPDYSTDTVLEFIVEASQATVSKGLALGPRVLEVNFVHRARSSGIRGGVGFLIGSDIEFFRIEDMPGSNVDTFESLFIKFPEP